MEVGSLSTYEAEDKSFNKHVLKNGEGSVKPNDGSVVTVVITPIDKYEFKDGALGNFKLSEEVEITIGEGDTKLSELLDSIIMTMEEGETAYVKTKLDQDGKKVDAIVGDKKGLKFNLQLTSLSRAADIQDLEPDELLDTACHHKERGTELYRLDRTEYSLKRFDKALTYLIAMEPVDETLPQGLIDRYKELKGQCLNNMSACYMKLEQYEEVVKMSSRALDFAGDNVKALFRRGQAEAKLNIFDKAKIDLTKALKLEPENKAVWNQLRSVEESIKKEKQMYQKMFS